MLKRIAELIHTKIRSTDVLARLGGDEFMLILTSTHHQSGETPLSEYRERIQQKAAEILHKVAKPCLIEDMEFSVTASIGIAIFPEDGDDPHILLKNADTAMYQAKDAGRNNYQFYSVGMDVNALERLNLETSLRRALEREEFVIFYQPLVNIKTGRIFGLEALVRWQHPDLGLISPSKFVPLLEDTGLIIPVGKWALTTACRQHMHWQNTGLEPLRISVNMSVRQFNDPDLISTIDHILKQADFNPSLLELEITESIFMQHTHTIKTNLQSLRQMGVRLTIDDFGTGYSSLSYLRRYPVDCLKIDQSFVRDITIDPDDAEIVKAILAMAKSLKLHVIAEGVETKDQLKLLREWGCESMQGFLLNPPLPHDDIGALITYLQANPKACSWSA